MKLFSDDIQNILPHRAPFVAVERALELKPGQQIVALKALSAGEFLGQGQDGWPPVLLIEAMAQAGRLAASTGTVAEGRRGYLVSIEDFQVIQPARWGDLLRLEVQVVPHRSGFIRVLGQVRTEEHLVAKGELILSMPRGNDGNC